MVRRTAAVTVMPVQQEAPTLDPRLLELFFDGLTSIEAFALSRIAQLPYAEVRDAVAFDERERPQIIGAAQEVAAKHRAWLSGQGQPALFFAALTAAQAAKLDALLLAARPPADKREAHRQLIWGLVLIFLPLLLFGGFFLLLKWSTQT